MRSLLKRSPKVIVLASFMTWSSLGVAADLSDAEINKWVGAANALKTWSKQHQNNNVVPDASRSAAMKDPGHAFTLSMQEAKKSSYYGDIQSVLKQSGYSDVDTWAQLGDRIMTAHVANKMAEHKEVTPEKMDAAMQQLNNAKIPPQLRAQMAQAMQGSHAMMQSAQQAPAEDKQAVARNSKVLEQFIKSN